MCILAYKTRVYAYRVQINGENVATAMHSHAVQLIRSSGDAICLKIITPPRRRGVDRPRPPQRIAVNRQQEPRLSTASNSGPGPGQDRVQRTINETSSRIARNNVSASQTAVGHLSSRQQLPTARSMPDLSTAAHNHSAPDHSCRQQDKIGNVNANDRDQASSGADYRDRVLYELTNRLRPSPGVVQPPLDVSSSAQPDRTKSQCRPDIKPAGNSTSPHGRPAPPPRGTSLSGRLHASTAAVSSLTASRAKSAGSEFKELLAINGHTGTSSRTGREEQGFTSSPSTAARSTVSGEHLVLPSQLKKLQRSPTNDEASTHGHIEDTTTNQCVTKLNGQSSVGTDHNDGDQAVVEHRSPVPKRPAPPPPSTKLTKVSTTTLGEVNFLVMAEQARKQYILSKLARETHAADKSSSVPANDQHEADARQTDDHRLHKAVNGSANSIDTNDGGSHFTVNNKSLEYLPTSESDTSPYCNVEGSHAGETVQTRDNSSPVCPGAWQLSDSTETSQPPPAILPKRRQRDKSQVEIYNNETTHAEWRMTSSVNDNGTNGILQSQVSTNEFSAAKLTDSSTANVAHKTPQQHDSNDQHRKSNSKLIRGKNVVIRRSGVSRLPPAANYNLAINDVHSATNGHKSCKDAEWFQQLMSMCDVGILPPPPDFAD